MGFGGFVLEGGQGCDCVGPRRASGVAGQLWGLAWMVVMECLSRNGHEARRL